MPYKKLDNIALFRAMANESNTERYFELLKDAKVKGYLFAQYNYIDEPFKKQ